MAADLSLSESLGGLRVTNPDDDDGASPSPPADVGQQTAARPVPSASASSTDTVTAEQQSTYLGRFSHEQTGQDSGDIGFNPDSYTLHEAAGSPSTSQQTRNLAYPEADTSPTGHRLAHRSSMPLNYPPQQSFPNPTSSSRYAPALRIPSDQTPSGRPTSAMYQLPNASSSSTNSYRYRDEFSPAEYSAGGVARSGSRSSHGVLPGGMPVRDGSRSHRSTSHQANGGNGPLPPRRNSRRIPGGPSHGAGQYEPASAASYTPGSMPANAEEWRERGAAVSTRQETDASGQVQTRVVKRGVKDFNFGRTLGEGSYSTVLAATDRQNLKEYAIKVLDKRHIIKEKKVKYVNIERDTLNRLTEHPGIVRLYYTFQDERSLYFVLDLATGGELLGVLKKMGSFDLECTRFYGAQLLDSIAYMHSRGVIHRDLKPENVLLDREMHTKITDFGTAKILPDPKPGAADVLPGDPTDGQETDRAVSFVGTAEYVSPELLRDKNACKASDLWAFGCIIFQLLAGRPPFKAANEYLTFQKILALEYSFPDNFPPVARDLVERLLVLEPANRLPVEHIKNHQFFESVQWGKSLWRQKAPRLKPFVPPPSEPIKLNGSDPNQFAYPSSSAIASSQPQPGNGPPRPQLRSVTELPPPSQLDIDWSPVLSNNERILKLGNLIVTSGSQPQSPNSKGGENATPTEKPKFRLFGGTTTKKRERLVLITSNARVVIAAAGGNEKKAKMDLNCHAAGTAWKSFVDAKGLTAWQLDTRDKHLTFEDPRATTSDPAGSKFSTQEWLDSLEQAREIAIAQSLTDSYSGESFMNTVESAVSSPSESLGGDTAMPLSGPSAGERHHVMRHTLRKSATDDENMKGRKRFSKRHSKSGLAAVF